MGALPASSHDRTRQLRRWKCHEQEDINSTSARGMLLGSATETMSLSLLLRPTPLGRIHLFKKIMQEHIVHVLSKITYSFAQSLFSHGQRSPQTCLQLHSCGTSTEDVSGDGLTSHRTSTNSLMHSRRNCAGSPKQPLVGLSGA